MKKHEFYARYANMPIPQRSQTLTVFYGTIPRVMTLNTVYAEIKAIDEKIRDDEIRREQLLEAVEPFLINQNEIIE